MSQRLAVKNGIARQSTDCKGSYGTKTYTFATTSPQAWHDGNSEWRMAWHFWHGSNSCVAQIGHV
jgi:hypothetical protein